MVKISRIYITQTPFKTSNNPPSNTKFSKTLEQIAELITHSITKLFETDLLNLQLKTLILATAPEGTCGDANRVKN